MATRGLAAHLTWKQSEMLLILRDGPKPTSEVSDIATMLLQRDIAEGVRPMYYGTDDSSIYGTLGTLERRQLVSRDERGRWRLTHTGRETVGMLR